MKKIEKTVFISNLIFLFVHLSPSLHAKPISKTPQLQKQVQALQETVEKLQSTVESQNQKIELLTEEKKGIKAPQTSFSSNEKKEKTDKNENKRSIGPWKYPVKPSGGWKLLPDISAIGIFSGGYFSKDPIGETGHDPSRTGLNLQEIEVGFQSIIDPYVRADIFLSFHEDGVELEEGYITTLGLPKGLQLRAGKYLAPFGRQNQKHLETWAFINSPLINKKIFGPEGFNELGIEASYLFPTPFFLQSQFSFSHGNNEESFNGKRKQDFAYTGRLTTSADLSDHLTFLLGGSAAFGFNDTGAGNSTQVFGGDLLLKWRPSTDKGIDWQTEYIFRRKNNGGLFEKEGGLSSYLNGQWSKRWGAGIRFDYLGLPVETERTYRISPTVFYKPTEFFRLRAQYDYLKSRGTEGEHAAFLQMIFNIGPHGAHQF